MTRVAVISKGSPNYLIDLVADGLIRVLGRKNVALDFNVRKGHGQYVHLYEGFQGPEPFSLYDAHVLVASSRSIPAMREWRRVTGISRIAYVEGEDHDRIDKEMVREASVYFKREIISGRPYPANVRPLPLCPMPEELPGEAPRREGVFYGAGKTHEVRRSIAEALVSMNHGAAPRMAKKEYNQRLVRALVGVAPRGAGWDTYRYWEIPYFGAALLAQRSPLLIPNNFVAGKEAIFFDSIPDFRKKLLSLLQNRAWALDIAAAGARACRSRHMTTDRARTVLDALL